MLNRTYIVVALCWVRRCWVGRGVSRCRVCGLGVSDICGNGGDQDSENEDLNYSKNINVKSIE